MALRSDRPPPPPAVPELRERVEVEARRKPGLLPGQPPTTDHRGGNTVEIFGPCPTAVRFGRGQLYDPAVILVGAARSRWRGTPRRSGMTTW